MAVARDSRYGEKPLTPVLAFGIDQSKDVPNITLTEIV
jgi:hypothetical protein